MHRVLMSSCLLGERVRYNGEDKKVDHEIIDRWDAEGRIVRICPELAGGLGVPRLPAEIQGAGGEAVLGGHARVLDSRGGDVTGAFVAGAQRTLELARAHDVRVAILTERSPSCGTSTTHDGTFSGGLRPGTTGVTAALLARNGIAVFSQHQIAAAQQLLRDLEGKA